jgi:hypothetical protein
VTGELLDRLGLGTRLFVLLWLVLPVLELLGKLEPLLRKPGNRGNLDGAGPAGGASGTWGVVPLGLGNCVCLFEEAGPLLERGDDRRLSLLFARPRLLELGSMRGGDGPPLDDLPRPGAGIPSICSGGTAGGGLGTRGGGGSSLIELTGEGFLFLCPALIAGGGLGTGGSGC